MKLGIFRLHATILAIVVSLTCFSNNPWMEDYTFLGSYNSFGENCEVYGAADNEGYGVCIELLDFLDKHNKFILIRDKELPDFINTLLQLKDKYAKWASVAKQNNVSDYYKELNVDGINLYALTTPESKLGAGLWKCRYEKGQSLFVVTKTGSSAVFLLFMGDCEEGEAKGITKRFRLDFEL